MSNKVAEEILSFKGCAKDPGMIGQIGDFLAHYGKKRRSGRYPWGSGENPYQHSGDFLARISELEAKGMSQTDIAKDLGLSSTEFRAYKSIAKYERDALRIDKAKSLRQDGKTFDQIANELGVPEPTVRNWIKNENVVKNKSKAMNTAEVLKKELQERGCFLDVGRGAEIELGVSGEKLKEALLILEAEGYEVYNKGQKQVTNPGQQTIQRVLCPPGTEYKEVYTKLNDPDKPYYDPSKPIGVNLNPSIEQVKDYISYDGGETYRKAFEYPASLDSSRLMVRYGDEGGKERDGLIELRRGCVDLDLGKSEYAQVRIMVDDTHYLKGMAAYADDLPDGIDVRFNTNKNADVPIMGDKKSGSILKIKEADPDNPFGSLIKDAEHGGQYYYDDPDGKFIDPETGKKQSLGLINKRADEGDWGEWANELPSQFLAKQNEKLIKQQLDLAYKDSEDEFNNIMTIQNPTIRKHELAEFASECDGKAESLKAAALPRQQYQVILPDPNVKDGEVYAPNFTDGETVALIRYPHEGTFQIPICKVNNKIESAKKLVGPNPEDAVVINSATAQRLSGADFDGDTVMVIPCNSPYSSVHITSTPALKGLENFDPDTEFPPNPKVKPWKKGTSTEQRQMGEISNLIMDMTLQDATEEELTRAVKHSMLVIDVAKHHYDYKKSEKENGIAELKDKYQGHYDEEGNWRHGANTLISKSGGEYSVEKRQGAPKTNSPDKPWYDPSRPIGAEVYSIPKYNVKGKDYYDPDKPEGSIIYVKNHETYVDKKGKTQVRMQKSTWMKETDDARLLSSGTKQEALYADYANKEKSLANRARIEALNTKPRKQNPEARATYKTEVEYLENELRVAKLNAPRERQAQMIADSNVRQKKLQNPDMTKKEEKKISQIELTNARKKVGAKRHTIEIGDKDWEAIQAGAISDTNLTQILRYTDADKLRDRAMPKDKKGVPEWKKSKAKTMASMGYSNEQIAKAIGCSKSSVSEFVNE